MFQGPPPILYRVSNAMIRSRKVSSRDSCCSAIICGFMNVLIVLCTSLTQMAARCSIVCCFIHINSGEILVWYNVYANTSEKHQKKVKHVKLWKKKSPLKIWFRGSCISVVPHPKVYGSNKVISRTPSENTRVSQKS